MTRFNSYFIIGCIGLVLFIIGALTLPGNDIAPQLEDTHIQAQLQQSEYEPVEEANPTPDKAAVKAEPTTKQEPEGTIKPQQSKIAPPANPAIVEVEAGQTFVGVLTDLGIDNRQANLIALSINKAFDLRKLKQGQEIVVIFDEQEYPDDLVVTNIALQTGVQDTVEFYINDAGEYQSKLTSIPLTPKTISVSGDIKGSFYQSAIKAGLTPNIITKLTKLLSYDVDFQRDIRAGDKFKVICDVMVDQTGKAQRSGRIHYAMLKTRFDNIEFYSFKNGGVDNYYDKKGRNIRKALLRTPVEAARISSRFGPRKHPILGYNKMHTGVDFAAPTGTKIYAAGDGKITRLGRNGGYGNYIKIRHNAKYSTAYAHLHKYAKGMRKGSYVKQGQVIGYVGSTGMSTGPHLHYEVHENGKKVNPQAARIPIIDSLGGKQLKAFKSRMKEIDKMLGTSLDNG